MILSGAALAGAAVLQQGGIRITVLSQLMPYKLPRTKPAPIAVFIAGHLTTSDGGIPPQLKRLTVDVNRHGLLQSRGLPVCRLSQIQPATTQLALANCGGALIGSGQFWAHIILPGQSPYPSRGRLLVFNGRQHGHPVVLAQIFTAQPFNSSFVIAFSVRHIDNSACGTGGRRTKRGQDAGSEGRGAHAVVRDPTRATEDAAPRCVRRSPFGTELTAYLPTALGDWGYLDRIKLTLKRDYTYRGQRLGYFNAACPAARGATRAAFPLASATFTFAGHPPLSATVNKTCGVTE